MKAGAIGSSAVTVRWSGPEASSTPTTASLLPAPGSEPNDVGDVVTELLRASSQLGEQQVRLGKLQVDQAEAARKEASARRKEALHRAVEAAKKAREAAEGGGFMSFVTDNLGVTGLVGLATFNWGLVAADVAAHQMDATKRSTSALDLGAAVLGGPLFYLASEGAKELAPEGTSTAAIGAMVLGGPVAYALERAIEKTVPADLEKKADELTSIDDDDVRLANKVALTVALAAVAAAGTVVTGGTSAPALVALTGLAISTSTQVLAQTGALQKIAGEKAAVYVALGGAITGAALTLGGSAWSVASAATAAKTASQELARTLQAVNGTNTALEGAFTVSDGIRALERADHQRDADHANIDAEAQRHVLQRIEQVIDGILEDLRNAKDSSDRAADTLQKTLATKDRTALIAGSMKV